MKQKKIRSVLVLSLVFIAITVAVSYLLESNSVKLPAVVFTDKVALSSEVESVLKQYHVVSMQAVEKNSLVAELENTKLPLMLENLKNEKRKYEDLIKSAESGDLLKSELYELDGDIEKKRIELEEARSDLVKITAKLAMLEPHYEGSKKKYDASRRMHEAGILNNSDFEKAGKDFWSVQDDYFDLKSDSLVAAQTIISTQSIINLLQARKKIFSGSADILASKHLIDINKVEADISDLQASVEKLKIYAPISGIITDLNFSPGERVSKGDVVAEIADLSNVWVIAYGSSSNRHKVDVGQKVIIYAGNNKKISGKIVTVSPIMEKVRALSSSFETVSTFSKIEIKFDDMQEALKYVTPGERLFVRVHF
jgi:multidrug resistance efflux pump